MHELATTEGIVLGKRGVGEANSISYILTKDLGLLFAKATSTRAEKSKLRFGLEPLTHARFSLVRGRHEWKLVGVENASSSLISSRTPSRAAAGRIAKLLTRLVHGEEPQEALFEYVHAGLMHIAQAETLEELKNAECVLVLRILSRLGYLPQTQELAPFVENVHFSPELSARASVARSYLIRMINESLMQTGL